MKKRVVIQIDSMVPIIYQFYVDDGSHRSCEIAAKGSKRRILKMILLKYIQTYIF